MENVVRYSNDIIERYRKVRTPDIADALDYLGMEGAISSLKPLWDDDQHKLVGPAIPMRQVPTNMGGVFRERRLGENKVGLWDYIQVMQENVQKGDVVVIECSESHTPMVSWGDYVHNYALGLGAVGAIIDGGLRDIDDVEETGHQVFYKYRSPRDSYTKFHAIAGTVVIDGITINPGDMIVADRVGICVIPPSKAEEVLIVAERFCYQEDAWTKLVRDNPGMTTEEVFEKIPALQVNDIVDLKESPIDLEAFKKREEDF